MLREMKPIEQLVEYCGPYNSHPSLLTKPQSRDGHVDSDVFGT